METPTLITIQSTINAPVSKVWKMWSSPEDIVRWNNASDDWHTPRAENDLRTGGKFSSRMESRDGSMGFDFWGTYTDVVEHKRIAYTMGDGRKAEVLFTAEGDTTTIVERFEAETTNSLEMQQGGWQAILDSFKHYVESH